MVVTRNARTISLSRTTGIFFDQNVRLAARLQFFDQAIAPVTPLGAAHWTIFRGLLHMMIGTWDFMGWKQQWHEILHQLRAELLPSSQHHGMKMCSEKTPVLIRSGNAVW